MSFWNQCWISTRQRIILCYFHPEDNWESKVPVGADNKRNLCASKVEALGDVDAVLADCKYG